jgi:hypothetical protein
MEKKRRGEEVDISNDALKSLRPEMIEKGGKFKAPTLSLIFTVIMILIVIDELMRRPEEKSRREEMGAKSLYSPYLLISYRVSDPSTNAGRGATLDTLLRRCCTVTLCY